MKRIYPNYYYYFRCRAGDCKHTCCAGWEIDIDPISMERFRAYPDIMKHVDTGAEYACFRLRENDVCPFLNANGLCDMIIAHGEAMLCDICADHPRFMNFLSDRVETGLGLCCEAAVDLILNQSKPFMLIEEDDGKNADPLTEDEVCILSLRDSAFDRLADKNMPVSLRIESILKDATCPMTAFSGESAFKLLDSLERLEPSWEEALFALCKVKNIMKVPYDPDAEHLFENLAYYFFYRHLLPATEDNEIIGRLRLCAFLWCTAVHLILSDGPYDPCVAADICRRLSCEIEYSDENISFLIEALSAK